MDKGDGTNCADTSEHQEPSEGKFTDLALEWDGGRQTGGLRVMKIVGKSCDEGYHDNNRDRNEN